MTQEQFIRTMKDGIKTTEFWLVFMTFLALVYLAFNDVKWAELSVVCAPCVIHGIIRGLIKVEHIKSIADIFKKG